MKPALYLLAVFSAAAETLAAHRLRSFLTILTIAVGMAAFVTLHIVGTLATASITTVMDGIDERSFTLYPDMRQLDSASAAFQKNDIERFRALSSEIRDIVPLRSRSVLIRGPRRPTRLLLRGDGTLRDTNILHGRPLTNEDIAARARVCFLTAGAYRRLFHAGEDPVGRTLTIASQRYRIVGVQAPTISGFTPSPFQGGVLIPYTTYEASLAHGEPLLALRFTVRQPHMIARTESTVLAYLQETRRKSVSYQTFDQASLSSTITNACSTLTLLLSVVSGVALLVAGIGIMNVMLVSVTERLREIGVRKAVGASDAAIFAQFFSEAFLLALAGCAGGLLLALIVGIAVYHGVFLALPATAPHFPWERALALTALVTSTITLIFGTYPAYQAMRRTPLEVLRAE